MPGPYTLAQEEENMRRLQELRGSQTDELAAKVKAARSRILEAREIVKEVKDGMTDEQAFNGPGPCTTIELDNNVDPHMWPTKVEQAPSGLKVTYDLYGKDGETIIRDLSWLQERGVEYTLVWGQSPVAPYTPSPPNWIYPNPYRIGDSTPKYPLVTCNGLDNAIPCATAEIPQGTPRDGQYIGKQNGEIVFWPNDTYEENGVEHPMPKDYRAREVNLGAL